MRVVCGHKLEHESAECPGNQDQQHAMLYGNEHWSADGGQLYYASLIFTSVLLFFLFLLYICVIVFLFWLLNSSYFSP